MKPTHSLTRGLVAGTPSSSTRAGGITSGAISSTTESTAKPTAAVTQMTHCRGVRRAGDGEESDAEGWTVATGSRDYTEKRAAAIAFPRGPPIRPAPSGRPPTSSASPPAGGRTARLRALLDDHLDAADES